MFFSKILKNESEKKFFAVNYCLAMDAGFSLAF